MATAASRARALSLYKALLRSVRTWPGPPSEKHYILEETRSHFRQNQHLSDPELIQKKLFEGETRHEIAWHYKIPYPRLPNFATGTFVESPRKVLGPVYEVPLQTDPWGEEEERYFLQGEHDVPNSPLICSTELQYLMDSPDVQEPS